MTLVEIDEKLAGLTTLGPNWDQEGGKPIKPQALTAARGTAMFEPPPVERQQELFAEATA
jgi:hypothetical protein